MKFEVRKDVFGNVEVKLHRDTKKAIKRIVKKVAIGAVIGTVITYSYQNATPTQ